MPKVKIKFYGDFIVDLDEGDDLTPYFSQAADSISDALSENIFGSEINVKVEIANDSIVD